MNKFKLQLLVLVILINIGMLNAQNNNGKIIYEEVMKLQIDLGPEMQQYADLIPSENKNKMELLFNQDECLYQKTAIETGEHNHAGENIETRSIVIGGGASSVIYRNLKEQACVTSQNMMGKQFLIDGDCAMLDWKIKSEQKNISGYNCIKAVAEVDSNQIITAWFTPEITIPIGPANYHGLPGLVIHLAVEGDNNNTTYAAVDFQFGNFDDQIIAPTKGKKVSNKEFREIVEKQMEEMQSMMGGQGSSRSGANGNVMIKVIGN